MIREFVVDNSEKADFVRLIADWQEHAAIQGFSDHDDIFGADRPAPLPRDLRPGL